MGKIKKVDDEKRIEIDYEIENKLKELISTKNKARKSVGDYFKVKTYYFDENNRFISKWKYKKALEEGRNVRRKKVFYLKVDLPVVGLKKGDRVPDELVDEVISIVRKEVRKYNTCITLMIRDGLTYDEARKIVDKAFQAYEDGEITSEELHDILSP